MAVPLFVSFEGGEGVGKTTQVQILSDRLQGVGISPIIIREPGSTPLGWHLRDFLKSKQSLSKEAELLLFEAARAELVVTTIKPSLETGRVVIADRYEASSIAYQGYGRKIDLATIKKLNSFATKDIYPDITFLLDLDINEAAKRYGMQLLMFQELSNQLEQTRQESGEQRRFEDLPIRFHEQVRNGYIAQANENPDRWVVIDASKTIEEISDIIWAHVSERLGLTAKNHHKQ